MFCVGQNSSTGWRATTRITCSTPTSATSLALQHHVQHAIAHLPRSNTHLRQYKKL
jgi:hypothetical protein